jgi:universal stress protein E
MKMPQQILVVISGKHKEHEALQRALKFAEYNEIHIHLLNVIYESAFDLSHVLTSEHRKDIKQQFLADRQLYMNTIAEELTQRGIGCSVQVEWHHNLHEVIEEMVAELQPDLVIKRISADPLSINPFALPTDRHLIRYCQAPLLLVNQSTWSDAPILAAVDVLATDKEHNELNRVIIESAKLFSDLNFSALHIVNAYITHSVSAGIDFPMIDIEHLNSNTANFHREKLTELLEKNQLTAGFSHLHLIDAVPEKAISQVVKQIKPQLVIMGSIGRTGVSAALIGNTAEEVLSGLDCEVLCLSC